MANWCNNYLVVTGHEQERARKLFIKLAEEANVINGGAQRKWFKEDRPLFDIIIGDAKDKLQVSFETKWSPPIEAAKAIFERMDVQIELHYEELGCNIYGRAFTKERNFYDIWLSVFELDEVIEESALGTYKFRGDLYNSYWECYEILLEEKIKKCLNGFAN